MADKVYGDRTVSQDPRYRYIRVNENESVTIPRSYEGKSGDYYQEYTTPIDQVQDRFNRGAYDQFVFGKNTGPLSSAGVSDLLNVTTPIITHEDSDTSYGTFQNRDARHIYGPDYLPGGEPVKIPRINLAPSATGQVVDHELGHNIDALLNHDYAQSGRSTGFEQYGQPTWTHSESEPVPGQIRPGVGNYLKSVGQARAETSGGLSGEEILDLYKPSHRLTEGWADAMTRMIRDPAALHAENPKLYEYMKQRINTDPKLKEIIKISKLQQLGQVPQYANDGGPIESEGQTMHDNRQPSKVTQKDRYGNQVTVEYAPEMKPLDPTELAKEAMKSGNEVPHIEMQMDHPGGPRGSDTVPAWLTPGEFVVNAEAMRIPGAKEQIEQINNQGRAMQKKQGGSIPSGYQEGGEIPWTELPEDQVPLPNASGVPQEAPNTDFQTLIGTLLGPELLLKGLGFNNGGQVPFIAGPRLNEPIYQDDGGWINDQLLDKLREVESGGDNEAVSPAGAIGAYQWLPTSAAKAGIRSREIRS